MFTSMLLILWVSIMTVMLFQKSPDQERTITSSTSSTSPSSLESTISDVFSLDHHHHHYSNNYNNCNNGQQQEVSWHAIVFLFYALWFCVFIFGAALIFWLEHNCTRQDWRKHKTRRLEYIESLLQRKKLQCSSSPESSLPSSEATTKCVSHDASDCQKDAEKDKVDHRPKTIISHPISEDADDPFNLEDSPSCCICLEDFANGDTLCHSFVCPHVFHVNCMKQWLLRHDACPCCRQFYLAMKPSDSLQTDPSYVLPLDVWSLTTEDLPHWFIMTSEL